MERVGIKRVSLPVVAAFEYAKMKYPQDYYYGVRIRSTVADPALERVGRTELHASLPVQSKMRRCLLKDDGTVNYYLHPTDSTKRDTGAAADLSGADGMVMVEIPKHYRKFEFDGTDYVVLISEYPLPGFHAVEKMYVSAYEATVDRSVSAAPKLASVVNATAAFRGGNNDSSRDGTYRSQLGVPASSITLTNFRAYARNRGAAGLNGCGWNCYLYSAQVAAYWLYVIEYANLNSQAAFNAAPDANGFKQGGLGEGVTGLGYSQWSAFNGVYGFIPCGYTNSLGNASGVVAYTMPFEYNASGAANYAGEYDSATAYTSGQFVSVGEALYKCIADAAAGTAVSDTAYFSAITRTVQNVPSYRGIENPFGHLLKWADGCKCEIQSDADGGLSKFYVCTDPAKFQDTSYTDYEYRGNMPRTNGYIKALLGGEHGDILPSALGGGSASYFCDYHWVSIPASGTALRGVLFGGSAYNGVNAGFAAMDTFNAPSYAFTHFGSRLCFIPTA